MYERMIS